MRNVLFPRSVLTSKGYQYEKNVFIGDKLYDYFTGEFLPIIDIKYQQVGQMYSVIYSDSRIEYYDENEWVLFNNDAVHPYELIDRKMPSKTIGMYPIEYDFGIQRPLYPDPYVAGALFMFGDYEDPYINIKETNLIFPSNEFISMLSYKYNIGYSGNTINHFSRNGEDITWEEFFSNYTFYASSQKIYDPIIPYEYQFAKKNDRIQFVRAIFDIGYNKSVTTDRASVNHWNYGRLELLQKILWSLGVPSIIRERGEKEKDFYKWRLEILGKKRNYPGLFYNIDNIEDMIALDYNVLNTDPNFKLKIEEVNKVDLMGRNDDVIIPIFYTDRPHCVYLSSQYLPRITG